MAGALAVAVKELLDAPLLSLSGDEVAAELREDFACVQQLSSRLLALVHPACVLDVPAVQGASSSRVWLAELLGMSVRQASAWTALAARLAGLPSVALALAAGSVNVEQASVIASTIAELPRECGEEALSRAAASLTGIAGEERLRPENLARHKAGILNDVAPEIAQSGCTSSWNAPSGRRSPGAG